MAGAYALSQNGMMPCYLLDGNAVSLLPKCCLMLLNSLVHLPYRTFAIDATAPTVLCGLERRGSGRKLRELQSGEDDVEGGITLSVASFLSAAPR